MMGYSYGDWGWGGWLAMILMMVAFGAVFVGVVVWAVRSFRPDAVGGAPDSQRSSSAYTILAERFARGEIDEDEFQRRRSTLTGPAVDGGR